ncbi:SseB family protein [Timonella sp. A28]|uniref:SseB family protein n=1 Tax=Timonella sp. A28 TaxID=3442640 RepID=UPI003EBF74FD
MTGKDLPPGSAFSGDDGSADTRLHELMTGYTTGTVSLSEVVARLAEVRVLVPVLASLDKEGVTEDGHVYDKEASAGIVALEAPDGRKALPVFSSVASMNRWRTDARPVPVDAVRAALSAVSEDWALLIVDPGSDNSVLVPRPAVWAIAQQKKWEPAVLSDKTVHSDITADIVERVSPIEHIVRVGTEPGRSAEVAVTLGINPGLSRAQLNEVLQHVNAALAASTLVSERVDSLELRVGRA